MIRKFGVINMDRKSHIRISNRVKFSPDGKLLFTAERHGSIHIYNIETGEQLADLRGHSGEVTSVAVSADAQRLVSVSMDLTGLVWDLNAVLNR